MHKFAVSVLVFATVSARSLGQSVQPQLDKMYKAYSSATSFSQSASNTTYRIIGPSRQMSGLQSEIRFQRPNKLYLSVTSPQMGNLVVGCDGTTMTIYTSKLNQFEKTPAPKDLRGILGVLARIGIGAEMDALFFLAVTPPPGFIKNAAMKPNETVNGTPCTVVQGGYISPMMMRGQSGTATLYIDPKSGILMKTKLSFPNIPITVRAPVVKDGKPVVKDGKPTIMQKKMTMEISSSQSVNKVSVNSAMNAEAFKVALPAGAVELKLKELMGKPK